MRKKLGQLCFAAALLFDLQLQYFCEYLCRLFTTFLFPNSRLSFFFLLHECIQKWASELYVSLMFKERDQEISSRKWTFDRTYTTTTNTHRFHWKWMPLHMCHYSSICKWCDITSFTLKGLQKAPKRKFTIWSFNKHCTF